MKSPSTPPFLAFKSKSLYRDIDTQNGDEEGVEELREVETRRATGAMGDDGGGMR